MGAINKVLPRTKVRPNTRVRVYNVLTRPVLTYGSEMWIFRSDTKSRITAAEILAS